MFEPVELKLLSFFAVCGSKASVALPQPVHHSHRGQDLLGLNGLRSLPSWTVVFQACLLLLLCKTIFLFDFLDVEMLKSWHISTITVLSDLRQSPNLQCPLAPQAFNKDRTRRRSGQVFPACSWPPSVPSPPLPFLPSPPVTFCPFPFPPFLDPPVPSWTLIKSVITLLHYVRLSLMSPDLQEFLGDIVAMVPVDRSPLQQSRLTPKSSLSSFCTWGNISPKSCLSFFALSMSVCMCVFIEGGLLCTSDCKPNFGVQVVFGVSRKSDSWTRCDQKHEAHWEDRNLQSCVHVSCRGRHSRML